MFWLKNTAGKPDSMLTIAVVTCCVVLGKVVISGMAYGQWSAGTIDGGTIAALLAPTLGAYVARRYHSRCDSPKSDAP